MKDLEIAKRRLGNADLRLSIVRDEHVLFETGSHGISGFLRAIQELGERFKGASDVDKIVGKSVAILCLCSKIEAVYGSALSMEARELFEENMVHAAWQELWET